MARIGTIEAVKQHNKNTGHFFFSPDSMRFFSSRVSGSVFPAADGSGTYFVTSEQFDYKSPRLYSVRKINAEGGTIDTIGEFQAYKSLSGAKSAAERAAK